MKKEQLLDMIGEAPERDVYDAGRYKRRLPRMAKWLGGIAAVLAVVLLVQSPGMPLMLSAKAVSIASEARILPRPKNGSSEAAFDAWREDTDTREALTLEARAPITDFAGRVSAEMLASADGENRLWSPINAYIALAMTAEMTGSNTQAELLALLGAEDTETPLWMAKVMEEKIPDAGLIVENGAGHFAYLERNPLFLRVVRSFLVEDRT